jgi:predicted phage-related endonuclease
MNRETREITSIGDWLTWREHDITASRIAALFDVHPYLTRDDLVAIMRGTAGGGAGPIPADSPAMRRGRILEPAVAAAIAEEKPEWTLAKATTYHRLPEHRLGCTPDYWASRRAVGTTQYADDGLIQIKTCSPQQWEKWRGRAPLAYVLQTLTEIIVTGRAWGVLAVMVCNPSYPVHYFDIPRHEAAEARILDAVASWWKAWDEGEIPHAAPSVELAAELDDGSYRDLSGDNELPPLLAERAELVAHRGSAEKRIKELDYTIKNRLGPASSAWLPGWQITFFTQHRRETIIPAKDIRVLRVKAIDDDDAEESAA